MTERPTLLLIADIAGYTRFMKFHYASLVHAQHIIGQLLEAVIDAAGPSLRLAKLEGDAAFFYVPASSRRRFRPSACSRDTTARSTGHSMRGPTICG